MIFTYEIHEVKEFELDFNLIYNKIAVNLQITDYVKISDYFLDNLSDFIVEAIPDNDYQDEWNDYTELAVADEWEHYIHNKYEKNN